jgi:hypothetical protein
MGRLRRNAEHASAGRIALLNDFSSPKVGASRMSDSGYGTTSSNLYFFNAVGQIVTLNASRLSIAANPFVQSTVEMDSLTVMANGTASFIGLDFSNNRGIFTLNLQTGGITRLVSSDGDGFLSTTTQYEHFGPDGLLYNPR